MMNKFLESAANDDQSLPYGLNHWTKDDPTDAGSDSRNWRRCDKPQPQPHTNTLTSVAGATSTNKGYIISIPRGYE